MRLPRDVEEGVKERIVEETLGELGLAGVRDVLVGGGGGRKGISGGERRR